MALSEAEKEWLERREEYLKFYCQHCQFFEPYDTPHVNPGWCSGDCWGCPVAGKDILYSFQDAAEFEARVAEQLVRHTCFNCPDSPEDCPTFVEHPRRTSKDCRLKRARLAVEAEMDRKS